jgi:hypothetical protein
MGKPMNGTPYRYAEARWREIIFTDRMNTGGFVVKGTLITRNLSTTTKWISAIVTGGICGRYVLLAKTHNS